METQRQTPHSAQAYPLQWPVGTPRTKRRVASPFKKQPWNKSLTDLRRQLALMGATDVVISTNMRLRQDGNPYATQTREDDAEPGVAVYFQLKGQSTCFPCDKFLSMAENFRAITLTISALRALDRYGVGKSGQAFTGFKALPANAGEGVEDPWAVLGLTSHATETEVRARYRDMAMQAHREDPNNEDRIKSLNIARDRILSQKEAR